MADTRICPYCAEEVRAEAVKCKHCGSYIGRGRKLSTTSDWVRSDSERMIAGVCGGLANVLGLPTAVVRLAFVLGAFFGWGIVIYLVLWIVMPLETRSLRGEPPRAARRDPSIERELGPDDPR
jgi:phage shock protein PspC (stress-responsive transcriptional regulator)